MLRSGLRVGVLASPLLVCAVASTAPAGATPGLADSAAADTAVSTTPQTVVPVAESWYRPIAPTCTTAVGCPPVELPPGYPEGTLHVGVLGGREDSTTYISLPLPGSGRVVGGSLRLPIGPLEDGTVQAESAKVKACLVSGAFPDKAAGSLGNRPTPDCSTSSPAIASASSGVTALTVDLAPFESAWEGESKGSLALVPADVPANTDLWHLAFSRHDRPAGTGAPLTAVLNVESTELEPSAPSFPSEPLEPELPPVGSVSPPVIPGVVPGVTGPAPTVQDPTLAGRQRVRPAAAAFVDSSFAYPSLFLLPLVVLVAGGWAGRAFTRDLANERT
jgi:hypothetical protein